MKKIIAIVILIMLVGFFIWNQRASFEDPIGTYIREFGIRKGLKKLVISSKIRIFIGENQ